MSPENVDVTKFIPLKAASERYGPSVETLRKWIKNKKLTAYKPSRRVLVSPEELEQLIAASK